MVPVTVKCNTKNNTSNKILKQKNYTITIKELKTVTQYYLVVVAVYVHINIYIFIYTNTYRYTHTHKYKYDRTLLQKLPKIQKI